MAKIFLDTNFFIDVVEQRKKIDLSIFAGHILFISPLSLHVLIYVYKYKIPNKSLEKLQNYFAFVSFDQDTTQKSLQGPTNDFEDNVQLHSASVADCDIFLTEDRRLRNLKFFGKTQILPSLPDLTFQP